MVMFQVTRQVLAFVVHFSNRWTMPTDCWSMSVFLYSASVHTWSPVYCYSVWELMSIISGILPSCTRQKAVLTKALQ